MNLLPILAAVSGETIVWSLVQIIIAAGIYFVANWGLSKFHIDEPFRTVIHVIVVLLVCLFLINVLLTIGGHPLIRW